MRSVLNTTRTTPEMELVARCREYVLAPYRPLTFDDTPRYCADCGKRLSGYNHEDSCYSCGGGDE